jgi:putative tricarboxylic transport membrane protein
VWPFPDRERALRRILFLLVLLAGGVFYSYIAFTDLGFMTRTGRLGPGFFPRIIGLSIVFISIWAIVDERRKATASDAPNDWRDVATLIAIALFYAVMLKILGGFLATVVFLLLALSVLNRGHHMQNAIISLLLPGAVYLLFDVALNASMPPGLVPFPV